MWKYRRGRLASHFAYAPCPVFESVFFARHPLITQHVSRLWTPQIMQKSCQVEARSSGSVSISTRLPETHENPRRSHNSRAFIGRKNRFGTGQGDDVIDDCCVISPAAQHRNANSQLTDWAHFLSYLGFYLTDFDAGWLVLMGRWRPIQQRHCTNDKKPSSICQWRAQIRFFSIIPILRVNEL